MACRSSGVTLPLILWYGDMVRDRKKKKKRRDKRDARYAAKGDAGRRHKTGDARPGHMKQTPHLHNSGRYRQLATVDGERHDSALCSNWGRIARRLLSISIGWALAVLARQAISWADPAAGELRTRAMAGRGGRDGFSRSAASRLLQLDARWPARRQPPGVAGGPGGWRTFFCLKHVWRFPIAHYSISPSYQALFLAARTTSLRRAIRYEHMKKKKKKKKKKKVRWQNGIVTVGRRNSAAVLRGRSHNRTTAQRLNRWKYTWRFDAGPASSRCALPTPHRTPPHHCLPHRLRTFAGEPQTARARLLRSIRTGTSFSSTRLGHSTARADLCSMSNTATGLKDVLTRRKGCGM